MTPPGDPQSPPAIPAPPVSFRTIAASPGALLPQLLAWVAVVSLLFRSHFKCHLPTKDFPDQLHIRTQEDSGLNFARWFLACLSTPRISVFTKISAQDGREKALDEYLWERMNDSVLRRQAARPCTPSQGPFQAGTSRTETRPETPGAEAYAPERPLCRGGAGRGGGWER